MTIVLLDTLTFGSDVNLTGFERLGTVTSYEVTAPLQTAERIQGAEVIVTNKVVIDREMMQASKRLKLICVAATGMNNIDLEAAKDLGIEVKNVAGYSTQSVVQHTFSMLFYLIGHSRYYDDYVQKGEWAKSEIFTHVGRPFFEVAGKKWGIIGMGQIGQDVAKVADAFGAEVVYYSTSGKNSDQPYHQVKLDTMLKECDIISIHAPLNTQTENLLHYENMNLLKKNAVLLNLGRGGIINEEDLARILDEKEIYAGVDVISKEPIEAANPLLAVKQERLYITPHIAWTSIEARQTLLASIVEHIETFHF